MRGGTNWRSTVADPEGFWEFSFLEVTDYDGAWVNVGNLSIGERNVDFLNTYDLEDDIDRNTPTFSASLRGSVGAFSLMPFRTDSPLNVDAASDYQPLLDLHREWKLWKCIRPRGEFPEGPEDYRERARGIVDRIDLSMDRDEIRVQGRGPEADLIDHLIIADEVTPKVYAAGTLATVLQAMLDDQFPATYTLVVESSAPSTFIDELTLTEPKKFWQLLSDTAAVGTGVVRFRYADDDTLAIHLFTPNREATEGDEDWSLGPDEAEQIDNGLALDTVGNYVVIRFVNASGAIESVTSPATPVSASIARYGLKPIVITLAQNSGINDAARAQPMADAIRADRELPILSQVIQGTGLWFGELWDYLGTPANGVLYDEDQAGGVVGYHEHVENSESTNRFTLAGKPKGRYATWLEISSPIPVTNADIAPGITSYDAAYWEEFDVDGTPIAGGIGDTGTVNEFVNSVAIEVGTDPLFGTVDFIEYTDVTPGSDFRHQWEGASRATAYYFRATPWTGPLSAGLPTGVAGPVSLARAFSGPTPTDTPTFVWDRSDPQQLRGDVVGLDAIEEGAEDVASAVEIGIPIWFYKSPKAGDEHLDLTTIPAAATEILSEYRHQEHAVGAGRIRLHAHVQAKTGTPTLSVKSSADDFGTTPTDCVGLSITGTGRLKSDWATLDAASRADVQFSAYAGDGADTAELELLALWAELLPDLVTAFRDHSDDFSDDFS